MREHAKEEIIDCIDRKGNVLGRMNKPLAQKLGLLHYTTHTFVLDTKNRLILQKRRKDKKIQPGAFDVSVGGHVSSGEDLERSAVRECKEELGIKAKLQFLGHLPFNDVQKKYIDNQISAYYFTKTKQKIRIQKEELEGIVRVPLRNVPAFISTHTCAPALILGWKKYGNACLKKIE